MSTTAIVRDQLSRVQLALPGMIQVFLSLLGSFPYYARFFCEEVKESEILDNRIILLSLSASDSAVSPQENKKKEERNLLKQLLELKQDP